MSLRISTIFLRKRPTKALNHRPALAAAIPLGLQFERHWRGASKADR
jgi:hypothetical protein